METMMPDKLKLMCILAHPDDESLGLGGILSGYAAAGVETTLITATRGERGWTGPEDENPGHQALGQIRTAELNAAAAVLGIREVTFLDYMDGDLDQADPAEVISRIVPHLRRIRPQVIVTFDPNGSYGHPDHIAISQSATAAIVAAAGGTYRPESGPPHTVSKLYYMASTRASMMAYQSVMGELVMQVDGVDRRDVAWEDWAITTRIDTRAHWPQVWQAISCHRSQIPAFEELGRLTDERQAELWGTQHLYRAFSLVNGGRQLETDLFAGLRAHSNRPAGGAQ
jgi:LmbE family N-acetylglucosaminyl deacetylase